MRQEQATVGINALALFTSLGTLLCCALPIVLVTIGLGSIVATITLQLPFLVTLSDYKAPLFSVAVVILALAAWAIWRRQECLTDPVLADRCRKAKQFSKKLFIAAASLAVIGFVSAYLLLPLRQWLDV